MIQLDAAHTKWRDSAAMIMGLDFGFTIGAKFSHCGTKVCHGYDSAVNFDMCATSSDCDDGRLGNGDKLSMAAAGAATLDLSSSNEAQRAELM